MLWINNFNEIFLSLQIVPQQFKFFDIFNDLIFPF